MKKPSVGFEWSYRDLLFTMMIAFMAMSVMALIISIKTLETNSVNQGDIMIELFWDKTVDADIDLWVLAPGDKPVSYARKNGVTFNLLRDDLGKTNDPMSRNQEIVVGRGFKAGQYIVNIQRFSSLNEGPIECIVSVITNRQGVLVNIIREKATLTKHNEEITVVRFNLDETGYHDPRSLNKVFRSLQDDWKATR